MDPLRDQRPKLSYAQTDTFNHRDGSNEVVSLEEQTAILQAMSLETPAGAELVQSPTSYSSDPSYHALRPTVSLSTLSSPTSPTTPTNEKSKAGQMFKSALQDARHFAGGLISHPYESTKHYSILRHSHGLVYYTGTSTNLAITIFSDRDLPPDRTLWLQRKGFSGKTGLKIGGLLGARSTWVNVTPAVTATPEQLNPTDERAWQRDIKKFLKKAPKEIRSHLVRETNILRIPCEADDGYLRVVLCTAEGKKVLCGSPIFRLASSSTDGSSIRGASLMTMPLEVGIKIASVVANNAVAATLSPAAETARTFVSSQVAQVYQPSALLQTAATTAYDSSGIQGHIDNANEQYDAKREESFNSTQNTNTNSNTNTAFDALARPGIIGDESGPAAPFPVRFQAKVVPGTGASTAQWNMPTANLTGVAEDILLRYRGVYFGWAAVHLAAKVAAGEKEITSDWRPALIFMSPDPNARRTVVRKNTVRVYVVHDFKGKSFLDAKLSVMMMGFLRGLEEAAPGAAGQELDCDAQAFDLYKDIAVATASLNRPGWAADATLERVRSAQSARSLKDRYVDLRQSSQRHIDRVPVHMLGIRTEGTGLKDRLIGNGGVCVPRHSLTHTFTA